VDEYLEAEWQFDDESKYVTCKENEYLLINTKTYLDNTFLEDPEYDSDWELV